ncbi:DNA methyltransferase [Lactiplantibacillus plantarum]|uniref:N-6 DNA methylase n=1 Tax=Lactiplantibacillus plantarum TaxID=1590 RepID=UPI000C1A2278|nr:N-6 DNA methylase [Lactiplantibacillus plantarum]PKX51884.1 DNA methyltransferase [Lactiplantibacillus plantarum]
MAEERLIKSNKRVKDHGEVFTPKQIVKLMLDQDELQDDLKSLTATFLEPAAGEGAFLTEVLRRKLLMAKRLSHSMTEYEQHALLALSSLYGIELLVDNTERLVMNMYHTFYHAYIAELQRYGEYENKATVSSAITIISANMVQGNALTGRNKDDQPIVFSEWRQLPEKRKAVWVQRTEYTFDAIINDGPSLDGQIKGHGVEELSLFELDDNRVEEVVPMSYAPLKITDVYKEKLIET